MSLELIVWFNSPDNGNPGDKKQKLCEKLYNLITRAEYIISVEK